MVLAEYVEIESSKWNDRLEVAKAIAACRARRAILVIAELERLARNVAFVRGLMGAGGEFVACDNPFTWMHSQQPDSTLSCLSDRRP